VGCCSSTSCARIFPAWHVGTLPTGAIGLPSISRCLALPPRVALCPCLPVPPSPCTPISLRWTFHLCRLHLALPIHVFLGFFFADSRNNPGCQPPQPTTHTTTSTTTRTHPPLPPHRPRSRKCAECCGRYSWLGLDFDQASRIYQHHAAQHTPWNVLY